MSAPLGDYIKTRRAELGLGQAQVGDSAGITKSHMSQIESGKIALPNADIRRRLAKALGVSHLDLLVAAGEITRAELGTVAGIVEQDPNDPKLELADYLKRVRLTRGREEALRILLKGMVEADGGEP